MTIPPYAIVNFKSTSRVVEAIRYFSDPKKVTAYMCLYQVARLKQSARLSFR